VPIGHRRRIFSRKSRRNAVAFVIRASAVLVFAGAGAFGGIKLASAIGTGVAGVQAAFELSTQAFAHTATQPTSPDAAPAPRSGALGGENVAVVDGETLRLSGHVVRLDGVAAPRRGEACRLPTDCARAAALRLASLVRDRHVDCTVNGADKVGRAVASCEAGGTDINRAVVASGWAFASAGSPDLKQAEQSARQAHLGLWAEP
jgi:endonuclease YncB( thermonuclease family)